MNPRTPKFWVKYMPAGYAGLAVGVCVALLLFGSPAIAADPALAAAVESKNSKTVETLLEQKADVNATQSDGMTALLWACWHDDTKIAQRLIAAGADAKVASQYGVTPLSLACTNGNQAIVELLLDAGADANAVLPGGETPLMTAARTGRPGPVNVLIARGADVHAKERKGQTALMWAAAEGHVEVVDALLKAGADFQTPLSSGFTPLFFAVREGRLNVVFRLLQAGDKINDPMRPERKNGAPIGKVFNPLTLAIENGHFELAVALLNAGADPNEQPGGYAPLHAITWVRKPIRGDGDPSPIGSGNVSSLDLVKQLVDHQADINLPLEKGEPGRGQFTTTGSTPFLLASRTADVPLMQLFLKLGADPRKPTADNMTPLLAAAGGSALGDGDETAGTEEEAVEAVKLLLQLGADVNTVDNNGESAMHCAAYQSHSRIVKVLADHHADITIWNQKNKRGWTPLMIAQGHRPGNFRPAPDTIAAIEKVMLAAGVPLPPKVKPEVKKGY
jgi:ankyrin repeat protein